MQARNQMPPRSRRRAKGDMDDLSPSHVFYLRRCVARLRILFCTSHNRKAAEETVPIRDHVSSRSNQRICIDSANSIMTSIRTRFAGATVLAMNITSTAEGAPRSHVRTG